MSLARAARLYNSIPQPFSLSRATMSYFSRGVDPLDEGSLEVLPAHIDEGEKYAQQV